MTDTERWVITSAVKERYGHDVEIQDVETEIRLYIDDRELTLCPGFYWLLKMQADEEAKRLAEGEVSGNS